MLSNWSCHVPKCLEKWIKFQQLEDRKQPKIASKFLQVKEKSNNGQQVKLGIPPDEVSDTSKGSNSTTSDIVSDSNPEAGQHLCHSKHSEASSDEALLSDATPDKETPKVFQHSPPVLVSQEGKLLSPHLDWSYQSWKTNKKLKFDPNQPLITDYTSIVSKVHDILQNADDVGKSSPFVYCHEDAESVQEQISDHEEIESQLLLNCAIHFQQNCLRN